MNKAGKKFVGKRCPTTIFDVIGKKNNLQKIKKTVLLDMQDAKGVRIRCRLYSFSASWFKKGHVLFLIERLADSYLSLLEEFPAIDGRLLTIRKETERMDKLRADVLGVLTKPWSLKEMVREVILLIREYTGFAVVAVRLREDDDFPYYVHDGMTDSFLSLANNLCRTIIDGKPVLDCICGDVIDGAIPQNHPCFSDFGSFFTNDFPSDVERIKNARYGRPPFRGECIKEEFKSSLLIPLKNRTNTVGLLQISDFKPNRITPFLIRNMENMALDIGITLAQKEDERILKDSEEKFSSFFQHSPTLNIISDLENGMILEVNDTFCNVSGFNRSELIGKTIIELNFWDKKEFRDLYINRLKNQVPVQNERIPFRMASGEIRESLCSMGIVKISGKERVLTILQDITETRRQYNLYQAIFQHSTDGLWVTDRKGVILQVNRTYLDMTGYDLEYMVGSKVWEEIDQSKDSFHDFYKRIPGLKALMFQSAHKCQDGSILDFDMTLQFIQDVDIVLVIFRNVTEKKKIEAQLIWSERLSAVGRLAGGVAHEFNNLLAIIKGNVALANPDKMEKHEIKESLGIIDNQVERGRKIVERIVSFSRSQKREKELCTPKEIINDIYQFQRKQFDLHVVKFNLISETEQQIMVNKDQFRLVFINLFSNAIHACIKKKMEDGNVEVLITEEENRIRISVKDNGIGMDETVKSRIFTPFYSTKGGYATDGLRLPGMGLGLSIAYSVIKEHDGSIEVNSHPGVGTEFIIRIPTSSRDLRNS